jgi:hypothetical protein
MRPYQQLDDRTVLVSVVLAPGTIAQIAGSKGRVYKRR